jgi:hypothetical protein
VSELPELEELMEELSITEALNFWGYLTRLPKERQANWKGEKDGWCAVYFRECNVRKH